MTRSSKTSLSVQGKAVHWDVRPEDGIFWAEFNGERFEAESLKKLADKLRNASAKTFQEIPFVEFEAPGWKEVPEIRRGVVTGVHSGNNNLLLRYEGSDRPAQHGRYGGLLRGDTDTDKLMELWRAKETTDTTYRNFLEANKLEVKE